MNFTESDHETEHRTWLDRLLELVARNPDQGIAPYLERMSMEDRWGTYRYLTRLADSVEAGA